MLFNYRINANDISFQINDGEDLTLDETLDVINANVIALCVSSTSTDLCECIGFGMFSFLVVALKTIKIHAYIFLFQASFVV